MSKQLSELCPLLVQHFYGDLPARVFSVLLDADRITLGPLVHALQLPSRIVRSALAVLVQQNLVFFYPTAPANATYYSPNILGAYNLVRLGRNEQLVEERFGSKVITQHISNLQYLGFATVAELLTAQHPEEPVANGTAKNGIPLSNGIKHDHSESQKGTSGPENSRHEAWAQLKELGYVEELRDYTFMPYADFHMAVEDLVRMRPDYSGSITGPKKTLAFQSEVSALKRKIIAGGENLEEPQTDSGQQEIATTPEKTAKRRKLNQGKGQGTSRIANDEKDAEEDTSASGSGLRGSGTDAPLYRACNEKLLVCYRNTHLERMAAQSSGAGGARVYRALLRCLEPSTARCHEDEDLGDFEDIDDGEAPQEALVVKTSAIAEAMTAEDLTALRDEMDYMSGEKRKRPQEHSVQPDEDPPPNGKYKADALAKTVDKHETEKMVGQFLSLLAEDPRGYLVQSSYRGSGEWRVDFDQVVKTMIQAEIEKIVQAQFGTTGLRVVRILYAKGKLDEKYIGSLGLIRQKELRATLTLMQQAGLVETQEVPRDNTRQPSRTIYLWFFDQDRVRNLVLDNCYKMMSRLLQRLKVEQEKVQGVLDKAGRSDVQGKEEQFLSEAEQKALAEWERKEGKVLAQLTRQDDLVMMFRDFLPLRNM